MKIQPINNNTNYTSCNCKKVNFKGEFLQNADFNYIMKCSNAGDLKRFKELLQKIKKVQDNLIFWVKGFYGRSEIYDNSGSSSFVDLKKQIGEDKKTKKTLTTMYNDRMPDELKLSWIIRTLEEFYKDVIPIEDKNNLMNEIKELLTE